MTNYKVMSIRMMVVLFFGTPIAVVVFLAVLIDEGFERGKFGGPYEIVYEVMKGKQADFALYNQIGGLPFSKAQRLDKELFEDSIARNQASTSGKVGQLYNYAIRTDGKIYVAVWTVKQLDLSDVTCRGGSTSLPPPANDLSQDTMIDWFIEEPWFTRAATANNRTSVLLRQSPCWVKPNAGVLDAIGKHFMLAQGEGTTVKAYLGKEDQWVKMEVAYAGEITVNVDACTYSVNDQSGTYLPENNKKIRAALITYFTGKLGTTPSAVNNRPVHTNVDNQKIDDADC